MLHHFFVRADLKSTLVFNVAFEDAWPQKKQNMFCSYPRKHFRAKKQNATQHVENKLEKRPEKANFQFCSMKERNEKSERIGMENEF